MGAKLTNIPLFYPEQQIVNYSNTPTIDYTGSYSSGAITQTGTPAEAHDKNTSTYYKIYTTCVWGGSGDSQAIIQADYGKIIWNATITALFSMSGNGGGGSNHVEASINGSDWTTLSENENGTETYFLLAVRYIRFRRQDTPVYSGAGNSEVSLYELRTKGEA